MLVWVVLLTAYLRSQSPSVKLVSLYPGLQMQEWPPLVLWHFAFAPQIAWSSAHSSLSVRIQRQTPDEKNPTSASSAVKETAGKWSQSVLSCLTVTCNAFVWVKHLFSIAGNKASFARAGIGAFKIYTLSIASTDIWLVNTLIDVCGKNKNKKSDSAFPGAPLTQEQTSVKWNVWPWHPLPVSPVKLTFPETSRYPSAHWQ